MYRSWILETENLARFYMKQLDSSQTAYQHTNASPASSIEKTNDHGWANAINRMIDQRYAFLALKYESSGYLFRGMSSGFFDALLDNTFWHYSGDDRGTHFEKELDVFLLSQDFSDALTVSRLWEQKLDACILIFRSEIFNQALSKKEAAMMATAEPGVVFKYPFLVHPLTLDDIEYFIVSAELLDMIENRKNFSEFNNLEESNFIKFSSLITNMQASGKIIFSENTQEICHRSEFEKILMNTLLKREISGSKPIASHLKPTHKP